jgi:DNA-binding MarR family transcriptional regulator
LTPRAGRRRASASPDVDYAALSDLRYHLRRFLRVREVAARTAGIEPQQYLVLLHVKGLAGREPATIGVLAERAQIQQHGIVQMIDRLERRGMVRRRRDQDDRRQVVVALRPKGEAALRRLAAYSVAELKSEGPALVLSLDRLIMRSRHGWRSARPGANREPATSLRAPTPPRRPGPRSGGAHTSPYGTAELAEVTPCRA